MGVVVYYTTAILVVSAIIFILLERKFPYRKGMPVFREGFWVDFVWYTLIQSYFLKILIFDYIIVPMQGHYHWNGVKFFMDLPLWGQVLFFVVTHDLYI